MGLIRSTYVAIESWPLVRLGLSASMMWAGFILLRTGAKVGPTYNPGCVFVEGRLDEIQEPILEALGPVGEFLAKKK